MENNNTNISNDVISNNNIDTNNVNPNNIDDNINNNTDTSAQKQNKQKLVFVLSKEGEPLMPTKNNAKVRVLLREKKAKVVKKTPFTIQLMYEGTTNTQPISLGVDAGSKHIGISATTKDKVLFEAEIEIRNDIVGLLSTRRENRRTRRNRKTRYRKPRFMNRVSSKKKGWLPPSIKQKVETHLKMILMLHEILPISKKVCEVASFDIQKIKNPDIKGVEYQQGDQLDSWNIREYVLARDNHKCQCCLGKSKDNILNVHHIESRKVGGDAPNNLVTLCKTCHDGYHAGKVKLPEDIKRGQSFKDAVFMGIMRWAFYNKLKELYPDNTFLTYGYITKNTRIANQLPKTHCIDARCISGNPNAKPLDEYLYIKKVRCHNRQIHKMTISKNNVRKLNQAPHMVKGYCLFDKVKYKGKYYFIFGRRSSGFFDIRTLDGKKVNKGSINCKNLKLIERRQSYLMEARKI